MTLSVAFMSPALAEAAMEGRLLLRVLHQAPDRPSDALVRAMARHGNLQAKAPAMEGRRFRAGSAVKRLTDLPMLWSEQWRAIGLQEPVQAQVEPS